METVFTNADFISLDEHNNTYSVMVVTYRDNGECTKLAVGESADFAVVDKNILKDDHDLKVLSVYIKGKKRDWL